MADNSSVTPTTPTSAKVLRLNRAESGVPLYGCEHLQLLLTHNQDGTTNTIQHYKMLLRLVFSSTSVAPQTLESDSQSCTTSLTSNYLCLQCPSTLLVGDRLNHAQLRKHWFFVDSRNGALFCELCSDFIYDQTLEDLRGRKSVTGSFTGHKRKRDDLFSHPYKMDPHIREDDAVTSWCPSDGLRGIYNMGATCFMSVVLQSFVHNPILRRFYLSDGHETDSCLQDNCLNCSMDELFQDFYNDDLPTSFTASSILAISWNAQQAAFASLAGNEEQDAHEFFQFLVEELHKTSSESMLSPSSPGCAASLQRNGVSCECIMHKAFYGRSQSTVTCESCNGITTSVEPFLDLSLGLDNVKRSTTTQHKKKSGWHHQYQRLTLQQCLDDEYQQPERCEYTCHNCEGPQKAKKQLSIQKLPNVLCLQFKRFEHDKTANSTSKIETKVQFPLQLNMLPYTSRGLSPGYQDSTDLQRTCTFDLSSVIVHSGNKMHTGHYVSYSRVANQWFMFDDHKVTAVSTSQVLSAEAFILFYIVRSLA